MSENPLHSSAKELKIRPQGDLALKKTGSERTTEKWEQLLEDDRFEDLLDIRDKKRLEREAAHKARMERYDAETEEAKGRKIMAEKQTNPESGIPEQIKETPGIKAAINALIPVVGEARAKAIVYGGMQQGWQLGASPTPTPDPYADIGKRVFEPVAKAMGESVADRIRKAEKGEGEKEEEVKVKAPPREFDPAEYFKQRKKELEELDGYIQTLVARRDTLTSTQGSPAATPQERAHLGVEIKNIDDYIKLQTMERDYQIQMFNLNEESKRRWAQYTDERERASHRDRQIDEGLALGKQILPSATGAARELIRQRGGGATKAPKTPGRQRIPSDMVTQCPSCGTDNIVARGTAEFPCKSCGAKLEVVKEGG